MIDSYTATCVVVVFLMTFGVVLPIFERIPKIKDIVSLRWAVVVIYSALAIGVTLDFSHLDNTVRFVIVIGGILLSSIFLIVRSIEKAAVNHWKIPRTRVGVKKGNVSAELSVHPKFSTEDNSALPLKQKEITTETELSQNVDADSEFDYILNSEAKQKQEQQTKIPRINKTASPLGSFYRISQHERTSNQYKG